MSSKSVWALWMWQLSRWASLLFWFAVCRVLQAVANTQCTYQRMQRKHQMRSLHLNSAARQWEEQRHLCLQRRPGPSSGDCRRELCRYGPLSNRYKSYPPPCLIAGYWAVWYSTCIYYNIIQFFTLHGHWCLLLIQVMFTSYITKSNAL